MTTATIPAPRAGARTRPVPWTRLAWVTWRQHRAALAGVTALLGVAAVYLAIMGRKIHDAYAKYAACRPAGSAACQQPLRTLSSYYGGQHGSVLLSGINAQTVPFLLLALPVLIGVFTGAPVLARELESGTFRFAWTQGCGRLRLTAAKLVLLAVTLTAAAFAFSLLFSWYFQPFIAAGQTSRFVMQVFGNSGVAFAAWTLLAFAMAAFLGVVIRRTVPAMAATLGIWTLLQIETINRLRQNYETPLTATGGVWHGPPVWILSGWWTGPGGKRLTSPPFQLAPHSVQTSTNPAVITKWLGQHHFVQWFSYQPATRFWPFQLIEGGWLLALSAVLITATLWLVRHRAA